MGCDNIVLLFILRGEYRVGNRGIIVDIALIIGHNSQLKDVANSY